MNDSFQANPAKKLQLFLNLITFVFILKKKSNLNNTNKFKLNQNERFLIRLVTFKV